MASIAYRLFLRLTLFLPSLSPLGTLVLVIPTNECFNRL